MPSDLVEQLDAIKNRLQCVPAEAAEGRMREIQERLEHERWRAQEAEWEQRGIPCRMFGLLRSSASGAPEGCEVERRPIHLKPTKALQAVGRFLSPHDPKTMLVLAGGEGVGKTVAACWGAAFHGGRVVKAIEIIRAGLFPEDAAFLPALWRARLLVLDDLGAEPLDGKDYALAAICDLVDRRYDSARKTIITTNLPADSFRERYGSGPGLRLMVRVREVGRFVEIDDPSLRV